MARAKKDFTAKAAAAIAADQTAGNPAEAFISGAGQNTVQAVGVEQEAIKAMEAIQTPLEEDTAPETTKVVKASPRKYYQSKTIEISEARAEGIRNGGVPISYNITDTAALLECSVPSVYNYLRSGKLRGTKFGRGWRVSADAIKDFVNGRS